MDKVKYSLFFTGNTDVRRLDLYLDIAYSSTCGRAIALFSIWCPRFIIRLLVEGIDV